VIASSQLIAWVQVTWEQCRQTQPETAGYLAGEALDVLQRTGDVSLTSARHRSVTARHARALGGAGPQHTRARLFLTMPAAAALAVLLVCDQGWNRSVLARTADLRRCVA
jgi:hypothetical protein